MTKNGIDLDFVGDDSPNGGTETNDFITENAIIKEEEEFLIDSTIKEEEERLLIESDKIANTEKKQFENLKKVEENNKTDEELLKKAEAEIREKRYKRLIHLLKNSKTYATILKNRLKDETSNRKRETRHVTQGSEEAVIKKQRALTKYKVHEVLTEKEIEENILKDEKSTAAEISDDFFIKTRVTNLGFTVSYKQPLLLEGGIMRDYQLQGLEWMSNLFLNGVNGILADEMGLGKTIQVISFICHLIEQNIKGPFLIVAPFSTITNWMAEFKKFAPKVPTILYHGPEPERHALLHKIRQTVNIGNMTAHNVIITSYQVPLRDYNLLKKINWYYLIIDEAQRIKNYNSKLVKVLKEFNTIGRLLLTGTPLQNNLSELWSLLNFLLPEVFTSLDVFESWFDITELEENGTKFMQEKSNVDVVNILQEILVPFVLRREKKDVNLRLPPKKEILVYCPLSRKQKKLYRATLDRSIEYLLKPNIFVVEEPLPKRRCLLSNPYASPQSPEKRKCVESKPPKKEAENFLNHIVLANPQMQLRKIVNHPYLIQFPLIPGTDILRIDEDMVKQSGKLKVLDAMLPKLKSRGHKVLLFSYFKTMLNILEDYLIMRDYKYCRLDGESQLSERDEEIFNFSTDPDIFIFLISIRAGGLGINLTAADTVIFFDNDWNPQVNSQSADRCHRIGQTKPVVIYRFCTVGTVDEKIIERGNAKRRLEKMILQKGKFNMSSKKSSILLDLQELKRLLESPNHDVVIKSNGQVFTDEELEDILDRSEMSGDGSPSKLKENKVFKVLNYQ